MRALVTGATGYIGGRLVPELLQAGWQVRVLARHPERLRDRPWADAVEVHAGDVTVAADVDQALADVDVAYYLVHSLTRHDFEAADRLAAQTFAAAAARAELPRLVYLGGPEPTTQTLSPHLRSRAEVGQIFLDSPVPTVVLRAPVIIGSGSASFEMLRYLTERLPVMVTPRWVDNLIQPIAVRDVLRYLVGVADVPQPLNRAFDIAGPDRLSYLQMMRRYAKVAGLNRRIVVKVPVLTPGLSSRWVGLVTPVPPGIARPLIESIRNDAVATEHDIAEYVPDPPTGLIGFDEAVALALQRIGEANVATRWSQASVPGAPSDPLPSDPDWAGGSMYTDERRIDVAAPPDALWRVIEGIGGDNGWYSPKWAWELRGLLDRAVGGVGLRRGRRDQNRVQIGESLDFWRVEERIPGQLLRLRAEMRLPGLAWLELRVDDPAATSCTYSQRAVFVPRGLAGHAYWWSIAALHGIVFGTMTRRIARKAERLAATAPPLEAGIDPLDQPEPRTGPGRETITG